MEKRDMQLSIGFLVGRVTHRFRTQIQALLKAANLSLSAEEFIILTVLTEQDEPKRMGELANLLERDPTTVKRQLDRLTQQQLVQRHPCPNDSRAIVVSATAKGVATVDGIAPAFSAVKQKAMQGISEADRQTLHRTLLKMLTNLNELDSP